MSSKTTETVCETVETTTSNDCAQPCADPCAQPQGSCGYDVQMIALWIVALLFIIIWTIAVGFMVSRWSRRKRERNCDESCDDGEGRSGDFSLIGGVLIWLIVLIIFVGVVYMWQWVGLVVFIVLAILIGAVIFASCSWGGDGKRCRDEKEKC